MDDSAGGGLDRYVYPVFSSDRRGLEAASPINHLHPTRARLLVILAGGGTIKACAASPKVTRGCQTASSWNTASGSSALTTYCPASTISEIFRSTQRLEST